MSDESRTDVTVSNNKVTIYGNVSLIGSISFVSVGFLFLGIWMLNNWASAIMLSAWLVYGLMAAFGLTLLALIAALWVKVVYVPMITAYERQVQATGQIRRNQLLHTQENAIVLAHLDGSLEVYPLLPQPQTIVEADEDEDEEEPMPTPMNEKTIIDLYEKGLSLRDIAKACDTTYYEVQKVTAAQKRLNAG
jgi:hypothetical protein